MTETIITGDSLSVGVNGDDIYTKLGPEYDNVDRQSGRSAAYQLAYMESKGSEYYRDKGVVISTGLLNSEGDFDSVRKQFDFLVDSGVKFVDVIGIPESTPKYKVWSHELWKLTEKFEGVNYMGSFVPGSDGVHPEPNDYERIYSDRVELIESGLASFDDFRPEYPYLTGNVNRLYNPSEGRHLFSANKQEIDILTGYGWNDEGVSFYAPEEGTADVYRFYVSTEGRHFYTASELERDFIINNTETFDGWEYEGGAFSAYSVSEYPEDAIAVVRFLNENTGNHVYSTSEYEWNVLEQSGEWLNEGVAWYADPASNFL